MASEVDAVLADSNPDPALRAASDKAKKMLETPQNTLCPLAQRLTGVIEDCIHKVEVLAMLPAALFNLDKLSHVLNEELIVMLRGHRHLVEKLDGLADAPTSPTPAGVTGGDQEAAAERHRANLEKDLQASLRNVLRQFRSHPAGIRVLKAEAEKVVGAGACEDMKDLMDALQSLYRLLVQRLLTTPEKEKELACCVRELNERHAVNLNVLALLEKKIAIATQERDIKISNMDAMITKLQSSLEQMEKSAVEFVLRTQQDAEKQSLAETKAWEVKEVRMQQEIEKLMLQRKTHIIQNHEAETALRKKGCNVKTEIDNWLQKYDADVGEKQLELEEVWSLHEEERQELEQLEEAHSLLVEEYDQIMEKRRVEEERRREELRLLGLQTAGALVIQSWWRGYCVRKALKAKGKGKKPKKGKAKKGK